MAAICRITPALGVNTVRAAAAKKTTRSVRTFAVNAGIGSKHWLPGTEPPAYLDGTMAGDYGTFDDATYLREHGSSHASAHTRSGAGPTRNREERW